MTRVIKSILVAVTLLASARGQTLNPFDGKLTVSGLVGKGAAVPANCTPTQASPLFVVNAGGSMGVYQCTATDTWTNIATVSGSGILTLNGNASTAQTIAAGTTGSDVNVTAAGGTVTIHIPTASGSVRGALNAADWTTFNSKAPATSGSAMLKGNGSGGFSDAVSGTDYAPATTGNSMLKASSGGFANAVAGTDYIAATSGSEIQKASSGGLTAASAGTDFAKPNTSSTWSAQQTFQHNLVVSGASGVLNASGAASSKPYPQGTSLPGSCTDGDTYYRTDTTTAYICKGTTWTVFGASTGTFNGPVGGSTTGHFVTYADTTGNLGADTLSLGTSFTAPGSNTVVPSTKAVVDYLGSIGGGDVLASGTFNTGKPIFGSGTASKTIVEGSATGTTTQVLTGTGSTTAGIPLMYDSSGNAIIAASAIAPSYGGTGSRYAGFTTGGTTIRTYTLADADGTVALLAQPQTWSANQSFNSTNFILKGSTSGTITVNAAATAGTNTITVPALTATLQTVVGTNHAPLLSQGTSAQAVSMAAGTTGQVVRGVTGSDPAWSTTTWPDTAAASSLLYANGANVIAALATANNAVLLTGTGGVPVMTACTSGVLKGGTPPSCTALVTGDLPAVITGNTSINGTTIPSSATIATTGTGTANTIAKYTAAGAIANSGITDNGTTITITELVDLSGATAATGLRVPTAAGAIPVLDGRLAANSTTHTLVFGSNSATMVAAVAATGTNTATTCTNQVVTAVSGIAVPTCTTLTTAYLPTASTILDTVGSTRGSILYRGASGWAALTPGTAGYVLQSGGAGADPSYGAISGVISGLAGVHALVTSASSTSIETLNSSAVMDASGNITTPGTMTTGSGTGQAGQVSLTAGTSPASPPANSVSFAAPSAITTAYTLTLPTAAAASDSVPMFTSAGVGSFVALTGASGTIPRVAGTLTVASSTTLAVSGGVSIGLVGSGTPSLTLPAAVTFVGANALSITTTAPTSATLPAGTVTLMADPMTTNGDMITRASGAATRVAGSSTANQPLLSVVGGAPVWGGVSLPPTTVTQGGVLWTNSTTSVTSSALWTQYGVAYGGGTGSAPATTAAGTTGQLLIATTSAAPAWTTATYPSTTTINRILYSSSANSIGEISTVNGGIINANSSGVPASTITPILGVPATSSGSLSLANATGSGYPTLKSAASTTSYDLVFPSGAGTAGYALGNSGTPGVLTWIELTGTGTVNSGTAAQLAYYATSTNAVSGNANATISNGALTLGVATSVLGQLVLSGNTAQTVTIQPAATAGNWTMTLPADDGTDGQLLKTNGAGVTSWVTATGTGDVLSTAANTYTAGMKQTVSHSATTAGLNLGSVAGDPSSPANGDVWINGTTGYFKYRIAGTTFSMVVAEGPVITAPLVVTSIAPQNAGAATDGTALLPWSSVYIGNAATNNIQLTGTAASAKVITLPGQTGTVTVAPTTTTANQHLAGTATAGLGAWSTSTYADTYAAGGMLVAATANTVTATPTPTLGVQSTTAGSLTIAGASTTNPSITLNGYTSGTGVLSVTATGTTITTSVPISPTSAGGTTLGIAALPFSSVYIGGSATNNIRLTGTSAAARVATIPDVAADSTFNLSPTTTSANLMHLSTTTAGLGAWSTAAYPSGSVAAGTILTAATANTITASATPVLGAAGSTVGTLGFENATSGRVTLSPVTGALGTVTLSLPAATDTLVGKATTDTLTNKTLDVEGTGNSITTVSKIWMEAAGGTAAAPYLMWDAMATLAPTAECTAGSTETLMLRCTANYPDSDGLYAMQRTILLPSDWSGAIDAKVMWRAAATSGDAIWQIATACRADAEVDDVAWNTATSFTADTAKGTANQLNVTAVSTNITATGCAAGELMHVKIARDRTTSGDTITGVISLVGVELTTRRAQ